MYARAVGKSIASLKIALLAARAYSSKEYHTAYATYLGGVDVCVDTEFLMRANAITTSLKREVCCRARSPIPLIVTSA